MVTKFDLPKSPEWRVVTPEYAEWLLSRNEHNRRVRPTHVDFLARVMTDGQYEPTTDGVGVRKDGQLTNGQHRLAAIVKCGIPQRLLIVPDMSAESYLTQDQRASARTVAEALGATTWMTADVHLMLGMMSPSLKKFSVQDVQDGIEWWTPAHTAITNAFGSRSVKGFAGASLRVGAGLRWAISTDQEDRNYVANQIKALVLGDAPVMSKAIGNLFRRMVLSKFSSGPRDQRVTGLLLIYHSFDPKRRDLEPVLRSPDRMQEWLTDVIKLTENAYLAAPKTGHPYKYDQLPPLVGNAYPDAPSRQSNKRKGVSNGRQAQTG
jgi:hypothetical protein